MLLRFGTDGIRGVANSELTPEIALVLGRAAARHLGGAGFIVGSDTRRSSPMLKAALAAGLAAEGERVIDVGVLPTPGIAWLAARRAQPGVMVSASHNPFADNGIKLISATGTKIPDATERAIEVEIDRLVGLAASIPSDARIGETVGEVVEDRDAVSEYAGHLASSVTMPAGRRLRIVCDCGNGAAAAVAPLVLTLLGVDAETVGDAPDGTNINAGCGATTPGFIAREVVERRADLGVAFDGDADRMIAVDQRGEVVDGDALLALFAVDLHSRGELDNDAVVATVMSNLGLRRALAAAGIRLIETPVGDRFVSDALERNGLVLGGEQSGHIVFRRDATTGDGILTGLKLLELVARLGRPLGELADAAIERLPQELRNVAVAAPDRLEEAQAVWEEVATVEHDLGPSGRVVLRVSGTEPLVRVMVEAESRAAVDAALGRIVAAVERELGPVVT
ncbi:MAG TPA: phosphoglucosamine mutase [Acidimicrobiales bacterium]|nr:phosphoglucosamine mutase [Acidimicrobiales bacterium]